jgi:hypothetical protein
VILLAALAVAALLASVAGLAVSRQTMVEGAVV